MEEIFDTPSIHLKGSFKDVSLAERFAEYQQLRCNQANMIPLCVEMHTLVTGLPNTSWFKLYIPSSITVQQLKDFIGKFMSQKFPNFAQLKHQYMLCIGTDTIIKYDIQVKEIYKNRCEKDGWLYIVVAFDNQK